MPLTADRVRQAAVSASAVLGITAAVTVGTQRWAGLDTPDSSFYATLALFGDEVTDRAPFPSYFWTRLGVIAPMRLLTTALGPWVGFAAYRALLLLVLVTATWLIVRRYTGRTSALFATVTVATSSVILSYTGNTYLTGTVLAGTAALIVCARQTRRWAAVLSGLALAWLVMANPPGALLAGTIWLAIRIWLIRVAPMRVAVLLRDLAVTAIAFLAVFGGFLLIGRWIFPRMNWFGAYLDAQQITLSNFASTSPVWLGDISLLVPLAVLIATIITWWVARGTSRAEGPALGLLISVTSLAFMLAFNPLMGGIALEAPMYQAMLWPPALIALACSATCWLPQRRWHPREIVTASVGVAIVITCGFIMPALSLATGAILVLVLTVLVAISLLAARTPLVASEQAGITQRRVLGIMAAWLALLAGFQLAQNSRDDLGLYYLSPYAWAYRTNPVSAKVHEAVNAQAWLLEHTRRSDRILLWVDGPWTEGDRELYVAAGMQLWGENRITLEPTLSDAYGQDRLATVQPTVIAMYGKTIPAVETFWSSLPAANQPTIPECYDFPWPADSSSDFPTTTGHVCLTRLSWPASGA